MDNINIVLQIKYIAYYLIGISFYLLPTLIASFRKHNKYFSIFLVNFFLGITIIGWIFAFAWALNKDIENKN